MKGPNEKKLYYKADVDGTVSPTDNPSYAEITNALSFDTPYIKDKIRELDAETGAKWTYNHGEEDPYCGDKLLSFDRVKPGKRAPPLSTRAHEPEHGGWTMENAKYFMRSKGKSCPKEQLEKTHSREEIEKWED